MWDNTATTSTFENVDRNFFEHHILPANRPAILKGFVKDWTLVAAGAKSPQAVCDYLKSYANSRPVKAWVGAPEINGKFSYNEDVNGPNFETKELFLKELIDQILAASKDLAASCWYANAIYLPEHLPGLAAECPMELLDSASKRLTSLWMGNMTRTAAHWDSPQNLACVIAGHRRFTLFPIDQVANLYMGPLDRTLAGQPSSLVDFNNPDLDRFPRFSTAIQHAEIAELEPGDVLYMPSMWIHHVESLEPFGAMINFWWQAAASYMTTPFYTLMHALLSLRELPEYERQAWRTLFDHYIFNHKSEDLAHIPEAAQGILAPMTPIKYQHMKKILLQTLSR